MKHRKATCAFKAKKGLNKKIVIAISEQKNEPGWMTDFRLNALELFERMPMPSWGADLSELDIHDLYYYIRALDEQHQSWETVPQDIKNTFVALGIPQAEQEFLAGVGAQYESEMVYKKLKQEWADQGVLFLDMNDAIRDYPDLFRRYFSTVIPPHDNKFAALNSAVWSGGSFVYVPEDVHIDMPLQAYFRINAMNMGQFERTLIIAQPNSFVHYVEGCSAPLYRKQSLHSAVVELIALKKASIRYTTIQNWSTNVYNLVTKRALAYQDAKVAWIDGNFGSKVTMKYPCVVLKEPGASAHILSIAVAKKGQHHDSGGKVIHLAPHTNSHIVAKSISAQGGRTSYRGLLKVIKQAHHVKAKVQCDALLLDDISRSDTYPKIDIQGDNIDIEHEASVSAINQEQLFYLMSRGLAEQQARALIVNGFLDIFVKELPMEYAVEINRLIAFEMEGSIG